MTEQVVIYGYRWFERTNGNTYHSVIVFADGEEVFRSKDMEYGYGEQYQETGFREFLKATGQPHPTGPITAHRWFEEHGIRYDQKVFDVKLKRELFVFAPFGGQVRTDGNILP